MAKQHKGGLIAGFDQLRAPDAPTIGATTAGDEQVAVAFTAASNAGAGTVSSFAVTGIVSGVSTGATGSSSPVTVTGLTNGTEATFSVIAISEFGASPSSGTVTGTPLPPPVGLFGGGGQSANIDKITITTTGNATDFGGDLVSERQLTTSFSNATKCFFSGGNDTASRTTIDVVVFASAGNATDFGDTTQHVYGAGPASNATRGLLGGNSASELNEIAILDLTSAGNFVDFGNLSTGRYYPMGACNTTRGVFAGGTSNFSTMLNIVDYVTIASAGNASDFGDLVFARYQGHSGIVCSSTKSLFCGGLTTGPTTRHNGIDILVTASTGNATDFGDVSAVKDELAGTSSKLRGIFAGGNTPTKVNVIDFVTIESTGNSTDFGDLTATNAQFSGGSTDHGGLA